MDTLRVLFPRINLLSCAALLCAFLPLSSANAGQQESFAAVTFQAPGEFQLTSYHQNLTETATDTPQWESASATASYDLVGVNFNSQLPLVGATSSFEYAWSQTAGFTGASAGRQMLQLSLQQQWQQLRYGLRYFSVGEAFGADPLA